MGKNDYARRFHAAMAKAFDASDARVRLAYFDLAVFYHGKLRDQSGMYPTAEMLRSAAKETCCETSCWCK